MELNYKKIEKDLIQSIKSEASIRNKNQIYILDLIYDRSNCSSVSKHLLYNICYKTSLHLNFENHFGSIDWVDQVIDYNNCLVISGRDFVQHNYIRNYNENQKVDYFAFADMTWSDIYNIYNNIDKKKFLDNYSVETIADKAYGMDITYAEFEWIAYIDKSTNIIKNNKDPAKHNKWFTFTARQKEIIALIYQIEKQTKSKSLNPFIFKLEKT